MALGDLLVRIDATTEQLRRELSRADSSLAATQSGVDRRLAAIDARFSRLGASIRRTFSGLLGPIATALGVQKLIQYADAWTLVQGRLKLVTDSTEDLANVTNQLFAQAQEARVDFAAVADLYARLARNTEELGLAQQDVLRLTRALNQAVVVSGASAQEAAAGLLQLAQGFASGALRGEELNSVLEQLPRVAEAIADGLGVTIGQLRAMGQAGKLAGKDVANALLGQADRIADEFAQMPVTVSQAMTRLNNAFLQLVGGTSEATASSKALADAISGIAEAMESEGFQTGFADFVISIKEGLGAALKSITDGLAAIKEAQREFQAETGRSPTAGDIGLNTWLKALGLEWVGPRQALKDMVEDIKKSKKEVEEVLGFQVEAPDVEPIKTALSTVFEDIGQLNAKLIQLQNLRIALNISAKTTDVTQALDEVNTEIQETSRQISEVGKGVFQDIDNTAAVAALQRILGEAAKVDAALQPLTTRQLVIEVEMGRLDQLIKEANTAGQAIDELVAERETLELEYHALTPQITEDTAKIEELKAAAKFVINIPIAIMGPEQAVTDFYSRLRKASEAQQRGRNLDPFAGFMPGSTPEQVQAALDESEAIETLKQSFVELEAARTRSTTAAKSAAAEAAEAPARFAEAVESLRTEVTIAALPAEFQAIAEAATAAGVDIQKVLPPGVFEKVADELAASGVDITQSLQGATVGVAELGRQFQALEEMSEGPEKQARLFEELARSVEFVRPHIEQTRSSFESLMDELERLDQPTDAYAEALGEVGHALAIGAINAEQYAVALAQIEATLSPAAVKLRAFSDQMAATGDVIGRSVDDSFANLVLGIESAHDVAVSLLRDIAREAIKAAQVAAIGQTFGQAIGGAIGGFFTGGATPTVTSRTSTPIPAGQIQRQLGGPVQAGKEYEVAEDGKPELFIGRSVAGVPAVVTRTDEMAAATDLPETVVRRLSRTPGGRAVLGLIREREEQAPGLRSQQIEILGKQGKPEVFKPAESGYVLPNPDFRALDATPEGSEFLARVGRAGGGPVLTGRSYDVAEDRKPELFVGRSAASGVSPTIPNLREAAAAADLSEVAVGRLARTPGGRAILQLLDEQQSDSLAASQRPRGIRVLGGDGQPETFKAPEGGDILPSTDFRALAVTRNGRELLARIERVSGGPVQAGRPYDVAEDKRPELFVGHSATFGAPSTVTRLPEMAKATGVPDVVAARLARTPGGRAVLSLMREQDGQAPALTLTRAKRGIEILGKRGQPETFTPAEDGTIIPAGDLRAIQATPAGREFLKTVGRASGGSARAGQRLIVGETGQELWVPRSALPAVPAGIETRQFDVTLEAAQAARSTDRAGRPTPAPTVPSAPPERPLPAIRGKSIGHTFTGPSASRTLAQLPRTFLPSSPALPLPEELPPVRTQMTPPLRRADQVPLLYVRHLIAPAALGREPPSPHEATQSEIQIPGAALVHAISQTRRIAVSAPSSDAQNITLMLPGVQGTSGATGVSGVPGGRGGDGGSAGLPGRPGSIGATALAGGHGATGVPGAAGRFGGTGGLVGLPSSVGVIGATAVSGAHGAAGAPGGRGGGGGLAGLPGGPGAIGAAALAGAAGAPGAAGGRGGDGGLAGLPGVPGASGTSGMAILAAFQHGGHTVPGERSIAGEQRGIELWLPRSWTVKRLSEIRPTLRVQVTPTGTDEVRQLAGDQPELLGAQAAEPFEAAKPGTVIAHRETVAILRRLGVDPAQATRVRELSTESEVAPQEFRGGGRTKPSESSIAGESGAQLYLPPSWTVDRLTRARPELPVEGTRSTSDVRQLPGTQPELLGAHGAEVFEVSAPWCGALPSADA